MPPPRTAKSPPKPNNSPNSTPTIRDQLAALQADACALVAWTALDLGDYPNSWDHHENAKTAARDVNSPPLTAYVTAQQAVILIDLGDTENAAQQLTHARTLATNNAPPVLRTWLAAATAKASLPPATETTPYAPSTKPTP